MSHEPSDVAAFVQSVCDNALMGSFPMVNRDSAPLFHCILLNHFNKQSLLDKDYLRFDLMILKALQAGYATGNYQPDKKTNNVKEKKMRDPADNLYIMNANGSMLAKTYSLVAKKFKGPVSEEAACILPG